MPDAPCLRTLVQANDEWAIRKKQGLP